MTIQELLRELNKKMPDSAIGDAVGASQATICRLRNGKHKSTRYECGEAIRKLAQEQGIEIQRKS